MAHFGSDNVTGIAPEIMAALATANRGAAVSYGADDITGSLGRRFSEVFDTEVAVMPVGTGTIANSLSLALLTPPWGMVVCHRHAHIAEDEANAPALFTGGAVLEGVEGAHARLSPDGVAAAATRFPRNDVHNPLASVLSITQSTELGAVYSVDEVRALTAVAREHGLAVHMDGARFANAVAALGCHPAEVTWKAGVEVMSFGATKNGCLAVEAILLFGERARELPRLQRLHKRAGQLYSKMRFLSAQLEAYLADGNWLTWAANANRQAARLSRGLAEIPGLSIDHPVEANEVFVTLPRRVYDGMAADGIGMFPMAAAERGQIRLVCSFDTTDADVDELLDSARRHAERAA